MLALLFVLGLGAAAPATGRQAVVPVCPPTLANQLDSTGSATQLVTVVAERRTSTRATLQTWRKSGDCWFPVAGPWPVWLGQHGLSKNKHEGDRTTPSGVFGFNPVMYGLGPNPGVRYTYHRIVCGDWWVEDSRSPFYNEFHHVPCGSTPPFRVTSEDMSKSPTAYRYLAVIDYNAHPIAPGRGSGIFLHVSRGHPTLGCVSLRLPQLLTVLRWLRPAGEHEPLIVIGTRASIRRF